MKNFIIVCLALLAFCSCAKDKQQMVKDRVEQYTQEGKYVLGFSSDPTKGGCYVVYMDSAQIAVDTLGKSPIVFPLGEMQAMSLSANVPDASSKFAYSASSMMVKYLVKSDLQDKSMSLYPYGSSPVDLKTGILAFKNIKLLGKSGLYMKCGDDNLFFFFQKPHLIYVANPATVEIEKKNRTINLHYSGTLKGLNINAFDEALLKNSAGYDIKLHWDGRIAQMPTALSIKDIYSIPISVFGTSKFAEAASALYGAMNLGGNTDDMDDIYDLGEYGGHQYGIEEHGLSRLDEGKPVQRFITKDGQRYIDLSKIATSTSFEDEEPYLMYGEITDARLSQNGNVYLIFKSHYFTAGAASWTVDFGVGYIDLFSKKYYNISYCGAAHMEGNSIRFNEPELLNPNADCAADYRWRDRWKVIQMR